MRLSRVLQRGTSAGFSRRSFSKSSTMKSVVAMAAFTVAGALLGGCDVKSFIDPGEVGRYQHQPLQKPILTSLSSLDRSIDDPQDEFLNAADVRPEDLDVVSRDYVIGKNDLVSISVTDLVGPGVETTKTTRVSESGNISLPLIGQVHAEGLTEAQLEQSIVDAYRNANLIQNAQVSVTVAEARARTFSVIGAVNAPGQYAILQSDFRVLDALVLAHDVGQNIDNIYVIRQVTEDPSNIARQPAPSSITPRTAPTGGAGTPGTDPLAPKQDSLSPRTEATFGGTNVALLQTDGGDHQIVLPNGKTPGATDAATPAPTPAAPASPAAAPAAAASNTFQFAAPKPPSETRTIRIPVEPLKNGDLRYNVVIRPHDMIIVPNPVIGEYYMGGHVARVGVYSLTGRKITLKEAVVSAGMLDGVAIPQRTDLIRRLGPDREVFARLDLAAIFAGDQPDVYLKPYDQVMVGTNILAPFIAAVRGGFRITYGFGFLYDRNYAPAQVQR